MRSSWIAGVGALLAAVGIAALPSTVNAEQKDKDKSDKNKVEIKGMVSEKSGSCPSITFSIGGKRIVADTSTKFEDGKCDDIANGKKVEVEGQAHEDGSLRAMEVDLDY